ncbi:MAG: hypothetical protein QNJ74_02940 [Trichodesmium sp. MO_231.B1]|nr:hypothetical protein [Trichodesmium sp. MO_231.B1]
MVTWYWIFDRGKDYQPNIGIVSKIKQIDLEQESKNTIHEPIQLFLKPLYSGNIKIVKSLKIILCGIDS